MTLLVLLDCHRVLGDLIKHGLILLECVTSSHRESLFLEKVLNAFTLERLLISVRLLEVLDPLVLSPEIFRNVSLQALDLE
jgi:hypothetical protein